MGKNIFVARELELTRLDNYLKQALEGKGLICFVRGQAGSGKTALVTEFASRSQEPHKNLAVAFGQSDSQTGLGDAHLPFREILRQLTGDVDDVLAKGTITEENANRLRKLLVLSGQALVEVGPDLIGIFVPGVGLATRLGAFAAEKVGWLDKLERLVQKHPKDDTPGEPGIEPSQIYEQYANVLSKLSEKQPLVLVLDDLQWADAASIGLLFHLGRRISSHRILILGTYRPEEVAIGRAGDRHPLEKVLAEFKRYFGDIWLDLDRAIEVEGGHFVNAFLDTEPNQLGDAFRQKLYQHTDGHPLFTIELLRNMQEQGDLVRDSQGRWVETPHLDWESLPERVEGVIEERIGRLGQELRQMLTVGCVEGEDFTAEVVARVQAAEARGLVQRLSGELERQHRLVRARGIRKLDPTGQRLSFYRFQHNLFQWYLYNELDEAERAYLHEDVGKSLETLYGDQVDEIVVQLARHFEEAGIAEKARHYLKRAGKQAAERFANDEAIVYFNRALDLTPDNNIEERFDLLLAREKLYNLQGARELQAQDLENLQELVRVLDDDQKKAEVALRMAAHANAISNYPAAITAAQEAICLAQAVQDTRIQAVGYCYLGATEWHRGDYKTARDQLEQGLTLSGVAGLRQFEASSLRILGTINIVQGDYDGAKTCFEESLRISRADGDRRGEGKTLTNLGALYYGQNDLLRTKALFQQVLLIFRETGDRRNEANLLGNLGVISERQGNLKDARDYYEQSQLTLHMIGDRENEALQLCNLGDITASLGDYHAAKDFLVRALQLVRKIGSQRIEVFILNGLGSTLVMLGNYTNASEYCEQSLRLTRALGNQQDEVVTLNILGFTCDCAGDYTGALERYEDCLQIARSIGYRQGEGRILANFGLLHHHLGNDNTAEKHCRSALEITREIDDPFVEASAMTTLGHALVGLGILDQAVDAYWRGVEIRRKMGQHHMATEPLAGLARVYLIQENLNQAQAKVKEILDHLENHTLDGAGEPFRIYLTCYHVLKVNQDPRAEKILDSAHKLLQEQASKIDDDDLRHSYLENVAAHREIVQVYSKNG